MKTILLLLFIAACAHNKPNYIAKNSDLKDKAMITVYWPRQWQTQWGEYDIFFNDKPVKRLLSEAYVEEIVTPGIVEVKSHHAQDDKFVLITKLDIKKGSRTFLKIDTQPEEVTLMGVANDVMGIATVVNGFKSEMKLQSGQGSLMDLKNKIDKDSELEAQKDHREFGFHIIVPMKEAEALPELTACCSSERVENIPEKIIEKPYQGPIVEYLPSPLKNKNNLAGFVSVDLWENNKKVFDHGFKLGNCTECSRGVKVMGDFKLMIEGDGHGMFNFDRKASDKISIGQCDKKFFAGEYICHFRKEKKDYKLVMVFQE